MEVPEQIVAITYSTFKTIVWSPNTYTVCLSSEAICECFYWWLIKSFDKMLIFWGFFLPKSHNLVFNDHIHHLLWLFKLNRQIFATLLLVLFLCKWHLFWLANLLHRNWSINDNHFMLMCWWHHNMMIKCLIVNIRICLHSNYILKEHGNFICKHKL